MTQQIIEAFRAYLVKRGYTLAGNITYSPLGLQAVVEGEANIRHFTQALSHELGTAVRLSIADFDNEAITEGMFVSPF
jgi:hypothetical protein